MKRLSVFSAAVIGAAILATGAFSQDHKPSEQQMPGMSGMHGGQGMQGMMGCPMMRQSASAGSSALIPQLPPGNEKLQAQMTAEIMQKAGEIAAKYVAQAK
jgi:hypothetical protein